MKKKLAGLFVCVVLALILLLFRITYINAVSGDQYARQVLTTSQSQYASVTMPYKRGDIIKLEVRGEKTHLFDIETGDRIREKN